MVLAVVVAHEEHGDAHAGASSRQAEASAGSDGFLEVLAVAGVTGNPWAWCGQHKQLSSTQHLSRVVFAAGGRRREQHERELPPVRLRLYARLQAQLPQPGCRGRNNSCQQHCAVMRRLAGFGLDAGRTSCQAVHTHCAVRTWQPWPRHVQGRNPAAHCTHRSWLDVVLVCPTTVLPGNASSHSRPT